MRKLICILALSFLVFTAQLFAYGISSGLESLPNNPVAVENCTAKVKVDAARLREEPSLDAKILGLRLQAETVIVGKICGKWVQVLSPMGDTAYMAAYLLTFPAQQLLEQWKKEVPAPTVGKKAKVKWASVLFRKYPSVQSSTLGHFKSQDNLSLLADLKNGWSLVESRDADGKNIAYGFVETQALNPLTHRAQHSFPSWNHSLATAQGRPKKVVEPVYESPGAYAVRTAWSPEVFALENKLREKAELFKPSVWTKDPGLLASR